MGQTALVTERLRLEPLADEHLPDEIDLDADPEVMRHLSGRARTPAEVAESHRERLARAGPVDGLGLWAGFLRAGSGEFAGLWMLTPPHGPDQVEVPGEADLGYRVPRRLWRQGLAKEGGRALLHHGFAELGLDRIFAQTMAVNAASRATMAALGMRYVRTFSVEFDDPLPGTEQGEVEYEIRRADWAAGVAD